MPRIRVPEKYLGEAVDVQPMAWPGCDYIDDLEDQVEAWRSDVAFNQGDKNLLPPSKLLRESKFCEGAIIHTSRGPARVIHSWFETSGHTGNKILKFRIQPVTKAGQWSKRMYEEYIGPVQQAYATAGDLVAKKEVEGVK